MYVRRKVKASGNKDKYFYLLSLSVIHQPRTPKGPRVLKKNKLVIGLVLLFLFISISFVLGSKIVAVVEAYRIMTTLNRPYKIKDISIQEIRKAIERRRYVLPPEIALEELMDNAGTQFHSDVVAEKHQAFILPSLKSLIKLSTTSE